jgi:hypothetical protein
MGSGAYTYFAFNQKLERSKGYHVCACCTGVAWLCVGDALDALSCLACLMSSV